MSQEQLQRVQTASQAKLVFERMIQALNRHDLEAMLECFAADFRSEQPFHPERNFVGLVGVRNNWSFFFKMTPDIHVEILNEAVEGDTVWTEVIYRGNSTDGTKFLTRGVTISGIQNDKISWSRLYVEAIKE
jgi:ketosteroid isomerase-like protein